MEGQTYWARAPSFLEEIAPQVGYAESTNLRILLRRRLGRGLRDIRG